ncbi:MAG: hypothetical protein HKP27_10510, partial [Myxococcales bacterium]|nr:hypothetical protein [Myxococcales bacterium]
MIALLLVAALIAPVLWRWYTARAERAAFPQLAGNLAVPGLSAPLRIARDRWGIPHISAESERDAYFGLGFAHAQDRPLQLLWWRAAARGELAAWRGRAALPGDRIARGLGFAARARDHWRDLPASVRTLLEAYAAGIEAVWRGFRSGEVTRPADWPESLLPVPVWEPEDSLAILKFYAWSLEGNIEEVLVMNALLERFGGLESRIFFPRGGAPDASLQARLARPRAAPRGLAELRRSSGLAGPSVGSSAVVVSGARSHSGKPLLVADAHAEATQPAGWYRAHLEAPGFRVAGATRPGLPAFWSGFTEGVAWASTYPGAVVADAYVETLRESTNEYHDGRRWRKLAERFESIEVRGGERFTQRIRETRHGPLLPDLVDEPMAPLAISWLGFEPGDGLEGFFALARAADGAAVRGALARHHEPVLRVDYVAADGSFGHALVGSLPKRPQRSQLLPFP